jgi:hypothetical protein
MYAIFLFRRFLRKSRTGVEAAVEDFNILYKAVKRGMLPCVCVLLLL